MPGFRTHYLLGNETLLKLGHSEIARTINANRNVFNVGLQGPDIFFYAVPSHFFHRENIGTIIHKNNVLEFFNNLIEARDSMLTNPSKKIADAYICGFIGHYTMDVTAHPYIHYRTKKLKVKDNKHIFGSHLQLETDIDTLVLRHYTHKRVRDFSCSDTIRLTKSETFIISSLLKRAISATFPSVKISRTEITHALWSTKYLFYLLRDVSGIKKHLLRRFDQKVVGHAFLSGMVAMENGTIYHDPCNLKKRFWCNPWDNHQISHENFFDLFERAEKTYIKRLNLYNSKDFMHLFEDLSDCSYDSGLPLQGS